MGLKKITKKCRSKGLLLDIFWLDCFLQLLFRAEGIYAGCYGWDNACYWGIAEKKAGVDLREWYIIQPLTTLRFEQTGLRKQARDVNADQKGFCDIFGRELNQLRNKYGYNYFKGENHNIKKGFYNYSTCFCGRTCSTAFSSQK